MNNHSKEEMHQWEYPMFFLTYNESKVLKDALKLLEGGSPPICFLCPVLSRWLVYPESSPLEEARISLKRKAREGVQAQGRSTLSHYLFTSQGVHTRDNRREQAALRRVWIEKLLAYNDHLDLPYPMFKTNWAEKNILERVLHQHHEGFLHPQLCIATGGIRVPWYLVPFKKRLLKKIRRSISPCPTLLLYLNLPLGTYNRYNLRIIWVEKLLEYKG